LVVVGTRPLTPALRRGSLISDELEGFVFRPGQDVVLKLPGREGQRRCPIAGFDPEELRLDVDLTVAGDPMAAGWAASACIGDQIVAEGPRG
jgi:NADPH-dependent ferric siderophore reductase